MCLLKDKLTKRLVICAQNLQRSQELEAADTVRIGMVDGLKVYTYKEAIWPVPESSPLPVHPFGRLRQRGVGLGFQALRRQD